MLACYFSLEDAFNQCTLPYIVILNLIIKEQNLSEYLAKVVFQIKIHI